MHAHCINVHSSHNIINPENYYEVLWIWFIRNPVYGLHIPVIKWILPTPGPQFIFIITAWLADGHLRRTSTSLLNWTPSWCLKLLWAQRKGGRGANLPKWTKPKNVGTCGLNYFNLFLHIYKGPSGLLTLFLVPSATMPGDRNEHLTRTLKYWMGGRRPLCVHVRWGGTDQPNNKQDDSRRLIAFKSQLNSISSTGHMN